ncbi:MAG: HAD family hydrolase [Armatimonadetes bacterium]|nr:HAD family hydrolase [Armatimonadota bacterium]
MSSIEAPFANVKAIFFDLDDTLCGYWDACKAALSETFSSIPIQGKSSSEMIRHWAAAFREFGGSLKETHWYPTYLITGEPTRTEQMRLTLKRLDIVDEDLARRLSESYMVLRDRNLRLFHDAEEVLQALHGSYRMGMITNGPADIQRQEVNTLGIGHFFDPILIEGEMGEGKPLQTVFTRAQNHAGCAPEELLIVGNSYRHDIEPAIEAGWRTAWIKRDSDVPPSASEKGEPEVKPAEAPDPDVIIHDLKSLLPLLGM